MVPPWIFWGWCAGIVCNVESRHGTWPRDNLTRASCQTEANTGAMSFNGTPLGQGRRLDRSTFLGKNQHHQRLVSTQVACFSFYLSYINLVFLASRLPLPESHLCRPQTTITSPLSSDTHASKSVNRPPPSTLLNVQAVRGLSPRLQIQKSGRSRTPLSTSLPLFTRPPTPHQICKPTLVTTTTPGRRALIGPTPPSPGAPPSSTKRKHNRPISRAVWHLPLRV